MKEIRWLAGMCAALLGAAQMNAAVSWEGIKAGLSHEEVRGLLGDPLMTSAGRGFEVWIYDAQREVVWLRGVVVAWTARNEALDARGRSIDLRGVGKPKEKVEEKKKAYVPRAEQNFGYERSLLRPLRWRSF